MKEALVTANDRRHAFPTPASGVKLVGGAMQPKNAPRKKPLLIAQLYCSGVLVKRDLLNWSL